MIMIAYAAEMVGKSRMKSGPIAQTVAQVVRRCRERDGLGYVELSRRLTRLGRDIPPLGLRKLEAGERRVDVDDLVALAMVFNISPITLMMPPVMNSQAIIPGPGGDVEAGRFWNWLSASYPITGSVLAFYGEALPPWERDDVEAKLGIPRT